MLSSRNSSKGALISGNGLLLMSFLSSVDLYVFFLATCRGKLLLGVVLFVARVIEKALRGIEV